MAVQYISFQFSLQSVLSVFSSFPLLCTHPYTPVLLYYLQTYLQLLRLIIHLTNFISYFCTELPGWRSPCTNIWNCRKMWRQKLDNKPIVGLNITNWKSAWQTHKNTIYASLSHFQRDTSIFRFLYFHATFETRLEDYNIQQRQESWSRTLLSGHISYYKSPITSSVSSVVSTYNTIIQCITASTHHISQT